MADINAEGSVVNVDMSSDGIRYTVEGSVGKYGRVFFTHQLHPTHSEDSQGTMTGFARTTTDDGGTVTAPLQGVWRRTGNCYKVYSLDGASNGDINYVEIDVDLGSKEVSLALTHVV